MIMTNRAIVPRRRNGPRALFGALALAATILGSGMAAAPVRAAGYVGAELGDVKPEDKAVVAQPRPVQLLFQFCTKGAPNGRATKFLKSKVLDAVKASGLFSDVSEDTVADGAILNVVIDNVIPPKAMQNAEVSGAATGATMFIAGSNIWDHYTSQLDYVAGPDAPKITRTAAHSVVMQMGLINKAPADAVKVEGGINGAVFTMTRQIVENPLNALAKDTAFLPSANVTPSAAPAIPAAAEAAAAPVATPQ